MEPSSFPSTQAIREILVLPRRSVDEAIETRAAQHAAALPLWLGGTRDEMIQGDSTRLTRVRDLALAALGERPRIIPRKQNAVDTGIVILRIVSDAVELTLPPEQWISQHANAYRLHTALINPGVTLIRASASGHFVAHRMDQVNDRIDAWYSYHLIKLPGAEMKQIALTPSTELIDREHSEACLQERYSRAAHAFGEAHFFEWQALTFTIVGVGRIGSLIAHTLVRQGCSVQLVDVDTVEAHNFDGDVLPEHEGLTKVDAVHRFLRGVVRPGARLSCHRLAAGDADFEGVLQKTDVVVSAVDNNVARHFVSVAARDLQLPHLDVGTQILPDGAEADLRLILPGDGCLQCVGGLGSVDKLQADIASENRRQRMLNLGFTIQADSALDFREQRLGSSRAWGSAAAHVGLRMLEAMQRGLLRRSTFQRVTEERGLFSARLSGRIAEVSCQCRPRSLGENHERE